MGTQMIEKFRFLAGERLEEPRITNIIEQVLDLERIGHIEDLTELLTGDP